MQKTEMRNENSKRFDKLSTADMIRVMNRENYNAVEAVGKATEQIAAAIDAISERMVNGGRLFYIGAGTSGRIGDASECPPTFGVDKDKVVGIIAGGYDMLVNASEGAEDVEEAGVRDICEAGVQAGDAVVGVSAAGNAAYVAGALAEAKRIGAVTVALVCNEECLLAEIADIVVVTDTGAEVITGSTRLKAGTAQKIVLNMFSTCAMVRMGNVYDNFMINVRPVNIKLRKRCIWIITQITGVDEESAAAALDNADGSIREAIRMIEGEREWNC